MKHLAAFLFVYLSLFHVVIAQEKKILQAVIETNNHKKSKVLIQEPDKTHSLHLSLKTVKWDPLKLEYMPNITIHPQDIIGYKLENNILYASKEITYNGKTQWVFLEELVKDKDFTVYVFASDSTSDEIFYIEKTGIPLTIIDPKGEPYRSYLKERARSNSNLISDDFDLIKLERYNIINAYKTIKHNNPIYLHRKNRFGVITGINWANMNIERTVTKKKNHLFPVVGIFADIPFFYKEFSFHSELFYTQKSYIYPYTLYETKITEHNLDLPLKIRYTYLNSNINKVKPYIEVGFLSTYVLKYSDNLDIIDKEYYIERDLPIPTYEKDIPDNVYFGAIIGGGIETSFIKDIPIYIGFNYIFSNASKVKTHNFLLSASFVVF